MSRSDLKQRYHAHKSSAKGRKIGFKLSFVEWLLIWVMSGQLQNRGQGGFVMSRHHDEGHYEWGNVAIIPAISNSDLGYAKERRLDAAAKKKETIRQSNLAAKKLRVAEKKRRGVPCVVTW